MITVVTGGSRGIGAAVVRKFAQAGHQVYFLYRSSHQQAQALCRETGAVAIQADVADEASVQAAFSRIPSVDTLICNAGIAHYGLISDISSAEWDRLFAVNVKGVYHCVRAALPHFLHNQAGNLITVSSMWGQAGASCEAAYSATKGAVIALTKSLAKELAPSGCSPISVHRTCRRSLSKPRWGALGHPKRWPMPWSFWPRRLPVLSPARF